MKNKFIVSRQWHQPQIETFVSGRVIGAGIDLDDFIQAMVEEIGNPTTIVTKAQLVAKLKAAASVVQRELQESTKYIV